MKNTGYSISKNIQTKIYAGQLWEQSTSLIYSPELLGLLESQDTLLILKN